MIKQNDNKLAISVVATLTAGIALIYILVAYPQLIFAVAGVSAIFLICAYILTQNIIGFINMKNKSLNVQIKNGMDDLSSQIEGMSSAQAQLGKATYLYTRQTAENVATLRGNYTDSQAALHKNLSVLANAQNKSTKLLIKYDQSNTTKLISTLKDIKNHLSDTFSQGFEQIPQADNADVVNMLESIVEYLKTQPENMDQALSMQINNVAHELQNISINISKMQSVPMQPYMPVQQMTMQPVYQEMPQMQPAQPAPAVASTSETPVTQAVEAAVSAVEAPTTPTVETAASAVEASTTPTIEAAAPVAETPTTPAVETAAPAPEDSLPGLTTADLDALYAEAEQASTSETAPEQPKTAEPVAETATEQPKATEPAPAPEPVQVAPVSDDPNKQLSADEIAALFAAAEPAPKKEEPAPAPEPVQVAPVSDDPNKQLSPDEIAALFAAAEPAPKKEETAPDNNAEEEAFTPTFTVVGKSEPEEVKEEPVTPTVGDMSDPNKQLSPDEIAALFAAAEPAPKKEDPAPEPVQVAPVSDDPNKQLSADEIAALFAAAEPAPKKEEPAPEPVQVTPVSDDPNKQLSPDEIAALFASIG